MSNQSLYSEFENINDELGNSLINLAYIRWLRSYINEHGILSSNNMLLNECDIDNFMRFPDFLFIIDKYNPNNNLYFTEYGIIKSAFIKYRKFYVEIFYGFENYFDFKCEKRKMTDENKDLFVDFSYYVTKFKGENKIESSECVPVYKKVREKMGENI